MLRLALLLCGGQATLNSATKNSTIESSGYNSNFNSFTLGLENNLNQLVYGISWGYTDAKVDLDNSHNKSYHQDVKVNSFSIYATKSLNSCFTEATLSYSRANNKLIDGKGEATTKGDYNSDQYQLMLGLGKSFIKNNFVLEPKLSAKILALHNDSYDLTNNIEMTKNNSKVINRNVYLGLGVKASYLLVNNASKIVPFFSANYLNNVYNNDAEKKVVFLGQEFITKGENIKHQFSTDLGFDFTIGNVEVYTAYTFNWKKNYKANNLTIQAKYLF